MSLKCCQVISDIEVRVSDFFLRGFSLRSVIAQREFQKPLSRCGGQNETQSAEWMQERRPAGCPRSFSKSHMGYGVGTESKDPPKKSLISYIFFFSQMIANRSPIIYMSGGSIIDLSYHVECIHVHESPR